MVKMMTFARYGSLVKSGKELEAGCRKLCETVSGITGRRAAYVIEGEGRNEHAHVMIEGTVENDVEWEQGMEYMAKEKEPTVIGS